ncbi:MAG: hypothetical protein HC871_13770 [Rhizobiales bacterium]|nr:hypothetical protein [Hyphomicrobiales bacterium]
MPAASDTAIAASLDAVAVEACAHLVPPMLIRREADPIVLPVTINAGSHGRLVWTFRSEHGVEQTGEAALGDLELLEQVVMRGQTLQRRALALPLQPPPGYHRLALVVDGTGGAETEIVIAPGLGFLPACLGRDHALAGLTAPLYGLRSARNAGIGDLSDLAELASASASMGADFIGINPVHALFPTQPGRISPYSPSSRLFLNTLLIALDRVPELARSEKARTLLEGTEGLATLDHLRASDLVDYPAVATFKRQVLEALFEAFLGLAPASPRRTAFEAFSTGGRRGPGAPGAFRCAHRILSTSGPKPRTGGNGRQAIARRRRRTSWPSLPGTPTASPSTPISNGSPTISLRRLRQAQRIRHGARPLSRSRGRGGT